jgi:hypothetical protein
MRGDDVAVVEEPKRIQRGFLAFGREAGDQVGADGDIAASGLQLRHGVGGLGAAVAALHSLEDQIVAGLQRQMEMGQQPRLARGQLHQRFVDLDAVERREAEAIELWQIGQQPLAKRSEASVVAGDVDAGEDDLPGPGVQLERHRIAHRFIGQRSAGPAGLPDRAEGAAMIAAGLHRNEAAHPR